MVGAGSVRLVDMHVHVDFMSNADEVVSDAARDGLALFANTVRPTDYLAARETSWAQKANVRLGVGMHPWWVADGRVTKADIDRFCELAHAERYVGEVGLDFSDRHASPESHGRQAEALRLGLAACGQTGGKVISLHAVRAADAVLDLLDETGCLESCSCVFHWFSGSTPALWRAIRAGCLFSINEMQARTRRAKEQLKLIPPSQLLLETDLPPSEGIPFAASEVEGSLERAAELLAQIRGTETEGVLVTTTENALSLMELS